MEARIMIAVSGGAVLSLVLGAACDAALGRRRRRLLRLAGGPVRERRRPSPSGRRAVDPEIVREFAAFIDMLVLCVDGGMNLHQAVAVAAGYVQGRLKAEMASLQLELQKGETLQAALEALSDKLPGEEIRGVVRLLARSQRLGTPVSEALRLAARFLRQRRRQRARKALGLLPLQLAFCALAFFLPPLFFILLFPAVVVLAGGG